MGCSKNMVKGRWQGMDIYFNYFTATGVCHTLATKGGFIYTCKNHKPTVGYMDNLHGPPPRTCAPPLHLTHQAP